MTTKEHLCELKCGRPAPDTTICHDCADHPRQAVNQFTLEEIRRLEAIARGEEYSKDVMARKISDESSIPDVLNLPLLHLAKQIGVTYPELIEDDFASHTEAVDWYYKIIGDCERAQAIINGHSFDWRPEHHYEAHRQLSQPMTYQQLVDWFWDRLNIRITYDQLRKWRQRGKIRPVDDSPNLFRPRTVLDAMQ